jgi:hypothetical protein
MINFSRRRFDKNFMQRSPRVEPKGTSDGREKGEKTFRKCERRKIYLIGSFGIN